MNEPELARTLATLNEIADDKLDIINQRLLSIEDEHKEIKNMLQKLINCIGVDKGLKIEGNLGHANQELKNLME